MENDVFVLILGANEGAYALSHAFFHDYGIRPTVTDTAAPAFITDSVALAFEKVPGLDTERMLLLAVERFYERHSGKALFLLPTDARYAAVIEANRDHLEKMFFVPRITRGGAAVKNARALLFAYRSTADEVRAVYGRVAAVDGEGTPTVLLAGTPPCLEEAILEKGSFALLAEDDNGVLAPVAEPLCAPFFFLTAADASLPEWLITDYVLCERLPAEEQVMGLYSLCPYRMLKKRVWPQMRRDADLRYGRKMATALFSPKREGGILRRLRYARLARGMAKK